MAKQATSEEIEMQMTPMIDVTFLLLIFFMCSIKFKLLDGKLAAYLPKEVGVNASPIDVPLEKISIDMYRKKGTDLGFYVKVNGQPMSGLTELFKTVKGLHTKAPDLKATIYETSIMGDGFSKVSCPNQNDIPNLVDMKDAL